jgi:YHS domain-containing protein
MNTRNVITFVGTFVAGALIALVVRAAMFTPHADHQGHPAGGGDYPAMVSNPLTPAKAEAPAGTQDKASPEAHAHHNATPANKEKGDPLNTVCAICGMDVDPQLETLEYQGKTIGFGCKLCAPKFKADPERYGPSYLKNEVIKR